MNQILEAARFARNAHYGYSRKYTGDPYIYHPMRVAGMVSMLANSTEEMVITAWLHDVVEDTLVPLYEIRDTFGDYVAMLVAELTNGPYDMSKTREQKKEQDRIKLANVSKESKIIKLCDRIDNLRDMEHCTEPGFLELYANESRLLRDVIGDAHEGLSLHLGRLIAKVSDQAESLRYKNSP